MRIAEILRGPAHQRRQEPFGLPGQDGRAPATVQVAEHGRVRFAGEGRGPVVNALPGHAEHLGDLGGGATTVEFQHGQGPPVGAGVGGPIELPAELASFPIFQLEPAHLDLPSERGREEQMACQKTSADLLRRRSLVLITSFVASSLPDAR